MTNEIIMIPNANDKYAIMPVLDLQHAAARRQAVVEFTRQMMVDGRDYGKIPGTGDKPTLLKPGAEKLASLFGLSPLFEIIEREMDWTGEQHGGEPFFYLQYRCTLTRGELVAGQGVGSCNSWEKKYRFRNVYPNKATEEDKANGRLETRSGRTGAYQVYVVKNPDPADVVNTIDKMAQKRALVAAVLIAVNASELFTQDVEDYSNIVDADWQPADPQPKPPQPKGQPTPNPAPLPDDEVVIREATAREFIPAAAGLLSTDEDDIKARMKALGYAKIPGNPADRVAVYKQMKTAAQPALVTDDPDAAQAASDTAAGLFD